MQWFVDNWIRNGSYAIALLAIGLIVHLIAIVTFKFKLALISMPTFFAGWVFAIIAIIGLIATFIQQAKA